ncbi:adenylate/guanylate cyclase domain-containing protein [Epibacterium ulvae]|uniref:adenylate/guanylate cyclase domain-containing protein n=1 Tax=Epibacterium ulvae TaxID=1156985 RepID=UPI001BFBFAEC|nr:adenylate/guanylate cyclase domain-containing protein [Epibacterium ulvae]MBT8154914.1 adenylate/guanylate cyclase domain-containing protein [Epibacterium ulvae]
MAKQLWHGDQVTKWRIITGLILLFYSFLHFVNLGLGLISFEWMDAMQDARTVVTRSLPGSIALGLALLGHAGLAFYGLVQRRTLRMPTHQWLQVILGLVIPLQLLGHIVFTRFAHEIFGVDDEYGYMILLIWGSQSAWYQSALLLVVWVHGCIGLHHWLRLANWWRAIIPYAIGVAVFVPFFALTGFLVEGRRLADLAYEDGFAAEMRADFNWPDGEARGFLVQLMDGSVQSYWILLGALAALYVLRRLMRRRRAVKINYVGGPIVDGDRGMTLLEMSQTHGVPHTALCGGKGRCTTCRVVIEEGAETLPPPSLAEARSLQAVKASPNMRLACQIRPDQPVTAYRVFRPKGGRHRAHASQGEERQIAILFLDMRGFTQRTAGLLPYDVVFLLNRFFDAIVPQITKAGGNVDKYMGDGLLAVFETPDPRSSARAALTAACGISEALKTFNESLEAAGDTAVRIGMGLHLGQVVVGEIGSGAAAPRTIIGGTVNAASRLEAMCKELRVELLVSESLLRAANVTLAGKELRTFELRGVSLPVRAWPLESASYLRGELPQMG